jgi:uncharacterized hydrophobic protein (TIGR00271 family)
MVALPVVTHHRVERHAAALVREIREASQPSRTYFIMTGLATVLASYGLLANSPAVIIGAMLVAMLLNPITGLSYALITGDAALFRRAGCAELLGALLVFTTGFAIGFAHRDLPVTQEMLNRTNPTFLDLVIAVAGGAAASYAMGNIRLNSALAGVAIATALVPPLADAGMLLANGSSELAAGAAILFASNYASVLLAAMVVFWLLGHRPKRGRSGRLVSVGRLGQVALFIVLAAHLTLRFIDEVAARTRVVEIESSLREALLSQPGARLIEVRVAPRTAPDAIIATVRTPNHLAPSDVARLEAGLPTTAKRGLRLRVRSVPVVVADAERYLFSDDVP